MDEKQEVKILNNLSLRKKGKSCLNVIIETFFTLWTCVSSWGTPRNPWTRFWRTADLQERDF